MASEGDVFVGDFWGGAAAHGFLSGAGMIEVFGACGASGGRGSCACGHAVGAAA